MTVKTVFGASLITGAHIERYRLMVLHSSLKLRLGGIHTPGRSPILVCREDYKLKGRTAKVLLPQVEQLIVAWDAAHPQNTESGT